MHAYPGSWIVCIVIFLTPLTADASVTFTEYTISGTRGNPSVLQVGDMDNDGDLDVVSGETNWGDGDLTVWVNDGSQDFSRYLVSSDANFWSLHLADMDNDGFLDIVTCPDFEEHLDSRLTIWFNDGGQGFTQVDIFEDYDDSMGAWPLDMDNDGDMDLWFWYLPDTLMWLENDGSCNFTQHIIANPYPDGHGKPFDMDDDGDVDVILRSEAEDETAWLENDGSLNFTHHVAITGFNGNTFVVDLDQDGWNDLVIANDNTRYWYRNDGYYNFTLGSSFASDGLTSYPFADLDGDGDLDMAASDQWAGTVEWWENDGTQNFTEHVLTTGFGGSTSARVVDLDQDGDIDILAAAYYVERLAWWESDLATGADIYVPDDYPTIQGAINAAVDGDTVIVRPGTYVENIDFVGKAITVKSEMGSAATIIDGNQAGSVVTFQNGEDTVSVLEGFTVTNGAGSDGGGIICSYSSPTITDCTIVGNSAVGPGTRSGGGIFCDRCSPAINNNMISNNSAEEGGGLCMFDSSPTITNTCVVENTASWKAGGILCHELCYPTFANCTVVANTTPGDGGGLLTHYDCSVIITNSIFWGNQAHGNGQQLAVSNTSTITISYSDAEGGQGSVYVSGSSTLSWGTGMIDEDPLFFDPVNGDFHLEQDPCQPGVINPCVDTGDPSSQMIDGTTRTDCVQDSGVVDMGYHYPLTGGDPVVDVKVNGSDQYIEIPIGHNNATIDWNLWCLDWAGTDCEVFLLLLRIENQYPVGVWSHVPGTPSYINGIYPYYTGPLSDMSGSVKITVPPNVLKKVWLIVDNVPNAVPDPTCMIHDHMRFMAK